MSRLVRQSTAVQEEEDHQQSTLAVPNPLKLVAVSLLIACGLIHLVGGPEHYEEASYIGLLFYANCGVALVAAVGVYQNRLWAGWALGIVVAGGALAMFLVSRLIGLPGYEEHVGMWLGDSPAEYLGIPSLVIEACFVAVAAVAMPRFRQSRASSS